MTDQTDGATDGARQPERRVLRVLIANEKRERLERVAQFVATLGHEVIAREIYVKEVAGATARERPDVALVGLGSSSEHALQLITEIVREAFCPVIALLERKDPEYVNEAATRGVFAYIVADGDPDELQMAIDIIAPLRRVPEPARRVRATGHDRAGQGDPHGPPLDRRRRGIRPPAEPLTDPRPAARRDRPSSRGQSSPALAAAAAAVADAGADSRPRLNASAGHAARAESTPPFIDV